MCELKDFAGLKLDLYHRMILENELAFWHDAYLPCGETVLDVGAGNGETARFYLNHGAKRVICVEPRAELLRENFGSDPRVVIVPYAVQTIKSDCEGGEIGCVIETHFPFKIEELRKNGGVVGWKIMPIRGLLFTMRVALLAFGVLQHLRAIKKKVRAFFICECDICKKRIAP